MDRCFSRQGFTLAELLVALAILGVIATFTIPKVLTSQTDTRYKAMAKEVASMISGAYQAYQQSNVVTNSTSTYDLTPYMNYVRVDTGGTLINSWNGNGTSSYQCDTGQPCLVLHNGGYLHFYQGIQFGGSSTTNALNYYFDADAKFISQATGPSTSLEFYLFRNGRITSQGTTGHNVCIGGTCPYTPVSSADPPWFNWN